MLKFVEENIRANVYPIRLSLSQFTFYGLKISNSKKYKVEYQDLGFSIEKGS